jgi:hypothetical protein
MKPIVWSNGGGTQSAAIAGLIVKGLLPRPDFVGIADTEREDRLVWEYQDSVIIPALRKVGVEVHVIPKSAYSNEDIWQERENTKLPRVLLPVFVDTQSDGGGRLTTVCSQEWKQKVIRRWLRDQGVKECTVWLGMSLDEVHRMKDSGLDWYEHHWPLIYDVPMRKGECIRFVTDEMGWPEPPGSSCWMCPNHTDGKWRRMQRLTPDQFEKACTFDEEMRVRRPDFFLHRSLKPLRQLSFEDSQSSWLDDGSCSTGYCFT